MSELQSIAIKAWWAARKAAGLVKPVRTREYMRAYYREHAVKKRARHLDRVKATNRAWYLRHHESIKAKRRQAYADNAEKRREKDRLRRAKGTPGHAANLKAQRIAREKDPAKFAARHKAWRLKNPERKRELEQRREARKMQTSVGPVDYAAILAASNGVCGICGKPVDITNQRAYHFDHIVALARGGAHIQSNIQVAHAKCNIRKGAKAA